MAVKVGSFVIPGGFTFSVDIGFFPRWAIFLFSNKGTEDTWMPQACGGIGFACVKNSAVDVSGIQSQIKNGSVSELWYDAGGVVAGAFLGDIFSWVRYNNGGTTGWAMYTSAFLENGWQFSFAGGYTANAGGQIVYYIAGDEAWEEVASNFPVIPGRPPYVTGWQPQSFFGIGAGGGTGSFGDDDQTFVWADRSTPTVAVGDWGEYSGQGVDQNAQWRGILDPNVVVQSYYGHTIGFNPVPIIEGSEAGGIQFSSDFSLKRTDTSFTSTVQDTGGFSSGAARMMPMIFGTVDSRIGSFEPLTTVGVPTEVDIGFTPEAVVFFSPGEHNAGPGDPATQGATGWGFCNETDEAFLIYGGHWNPPVAFQSAIFMSSNRSWCGNYLTPGVSGSVGTMVNMGSARIIPNGFEFTTMEDAGGPVHRVSYWAIAPSGAVPGFFMTID
jgi:hypothetical protein